MASNGQNIIIHPGIVDHVERDKVFIKVLSQSACSTCHAKGACTISEVEEKVIEVLQRDTGKYKSGDPVTVQMKKSLGTKAVILGYIVPLLILVASIITLVLVLENEGLAALLSLLLLAPYYIALYVLRDRLKQHFSFSLYPED